MKLNDLAKAKRLGPIVSDYLLSTVHGFTQVMAVLLVISEKVLSVPARGEAPRRRVSVLLYRRETVDPRYHDRMPPQS